MLVLPYRWASLIRTGQVPARFARPGTGEGVPGGAQREGASPHVSQHPGDHLLVDAREVVLLAP